MAEMAVLELMEEEEENNEGGFLTVGCKTRVNVGGMLDY